MISTLTDIIKETLTGLGYEENGDFAISVSGYEFGMDGSIAVFSVEIACEISLNLPKPIKGDTIDAAIAETDKIVSALRQTDYPSDYGGLRITGNLNPSTAKVSLKLSFRR